MDSKTLFSSHNAMLRPPKASDLSWQKSNIQPALDYTTGKYDPPISVAFPLLGGSRLSLSADHEFINSCQISYMDI